MRAKLDLRREQSPVKDQGQRPTCLACAVTAGHEYIRGDERCLSVEYLHWASVTRDGSSNQGVSLNTTVRVLLELGQPYEERWPYQTWVSDATLICEPPTTIYPQDCFRVGWTYEIRSSIEDLKLHMEAGRAVVIGIRLFGAFHTTPDGRIPLPDSGESDCGRHAVLLVGYDDCEESFTFRNSWGVTWGDAGYGWLPYSYVRDHTLGAHVFSNEHLGGADGHASAWR